VKVGNSSHRIPNPTNPTPAPQITQSTIEISDLLDTLPIDGCVELTRRLRTAAPTLLSGEARSQAVPKIVLFVVEYGSTA
jgi:hypothetical protein